MATIDPAKAAARRKAQRATAKAVKKGTGNPISGMAKAAAKTVATRNGPKATETAHLSTQQFTGGRHHAPSAQGAKKNASGSETALSRGSHSESRTSGKHHAEPSMTSARKNASGSMDAKPAGRHSASSGPKHAFRLPDKAGAGLHEKERMHDLKGAVRDRQGTGRVGKHRKPGA